MDKPEMADEFFGQVPPGWSRDGYVAYLRHMVKVCKPIRPDRAEYWSQWLEQLLAGESD